MTTQPAPGVTAAITAAARLTGASASYLTAAARRESAFDPDARAATSSASGLFQFIDSTWMDTLQRHAGALGLETEAALPREEALKLRFDPKLSALLAGALAADNAETLEKRLGRAPTDGDLYVAHVLGASGAAELIEALEKPDQAAAELFPAAARANKGLFYARGGEPVSVADLYGRLAASLDGAEAAVPAPAGEGAATAAATAVAGVVEGTGRAGAGALKLTPQTLEILGLLRAPERADDGDERPRKGRA